MHYSKSVNFLLIQSGYICLSRRRSCLACPLFSFHLLNFRQLFFLVAVVRVLGSRLLVLLVLRHQIVHVRLGLGELHLVHALSGEPVEEGSTTEHGSELIRDSLEQLLDGGGVADEGARHLQASRRDVANRYLDVIRNPLDEIWRVLTLHLNSRER